MNSTIVQSLIRYKLFHDSKDLQDFVSIEHMLKDFTWGEECGRILLKHRIGSKLLGTTTEDSDDDYMNLHKSMIVSPDFGLGSFDYVGVSRNDLNEDQSCFSMIGHILNLVDRKKNVHPSTLGKIFSHLYAVKHDLIDEIYDRDSYDLYHDFLLSPGYANGFWLKSRELFSVLKFAIPDRECDWIDHFDNSPLHSIKKAKWGELGKFREPEVDDELGYDLYYSKRFLQDMIVVTAVLNQEGKKIDQEKKDFIIRLKNKSVEFDEYKEIKEELWHDFHGALSSVRHQYFLGEGHDIEQSISRKTFGNRGLINLFINLSELQRY
jgi:hypothetical protein